MEIVKDLTFVCGGRDLRVLDIQDESNVGFIDRGGVPLHGDIRGKVIEEAVAMSVKGIGRGECSLLAEEGLEEGGCFSIVVCIVGRRELS